MKVCAIIAEYNPFHQGHAYQIHMARMQFDHVIVIMSGNFVQRGECACYDKWIRTKWALQAGASLVLELPACYALQNAQRFALGAVRILNDLGVVNNLVFGSESNDIERLEQLAVFLTREPDAYKVILKEKLSKGNSFIRAQQSAVEQILGVEAKKLLDSPNDILAVEYIRALNKVESAIIPFSIQRKDALHQETEINPDSAFASASSIRKELGQLHFESIRSYVPEFVFSDMLSLMEKENVSPVKPEYFEHTIITLLRRMTLDELRMFPDIIEGLENRLKNAADISSSWVELLKETVTSRYTAARIRRILCCVLLNITKELTQYEGQLYARLLGFRKDSQSLFNSLEASCSLPFIMKTAEFPKEHPAWPVFQADLRASDIYSLALKKEKSRSSRDYSEPLVIL